MDVTSERLKALRGERSQGEIALYSGIPQTTLSGWEKKAPKTIEQLIKLAGYYKVSADYLLGFTDDSTPNRTKLPGNAREFLAIYAQLSIFRKRELLAFAETLLEIEQEEKELVEENQLEVIDQLADELGSLIGQSAADTLVAMLAAAMLRTSSEESSNHSEQIG